MNIKIIIGKTKSKLSKILFLISLLVEYFIKKFSLVCSILTLLQQGSGYGNMNSLN